MLDYPSIRAQLNTTVKLKKILATNEIKQHVEIEMVRSVCNCNIFLLNFNILLVFWYHRSLTEQSTLLQL